jgi:hypothetical protein
MTNSSSLECKILEADFGKDTVTLEMKHPYRVGAGRYWLLTDAAYDRLCKASDPKPLG